MPDLAEPIAIVGMQGRFPGDARAPREFWAQLLAAECAVTEVPASRWSNRRFATADLAAGKTPISRGCFLNYPYRCFDPDVFGFAPDEIANMDPQQRLILEVAWEALEIAGIPPAHLSGSKTGVYMGGFTTDFLLSQFSVQARSSLGRHSAAGSTLTMLSNRLSYALDLHGPSVTIDTACASSLSALSIAVRDLQAGLCPTALVGGVNFMLRPEYQIGMSAANLLAIDGRSKPFSALADGYGRGEGCGVLVLKPLSAAQRDGDTLWAVIAAAGTGHDGRTAGISLPNGEAQRNLMRQVLDQAALTPDAVGYVEAHGTGTPQGDPVEAQSIAAVYGRGRQGAMPFGSLKANIGHLEAAAGVAGVIKAVLMLHARQIPPHLMVGRPNPAISFDAMNLRLPHAAEPLECDHIAVNAFGYGGSTAHVILSRPPVIETKAVNIGPSPTGPVLLPFAAQSEDALASWLPHVAETVQEGLSLNDLVHTLAHRRQRGPYRAAVWATHSNAATEIRDALKTPAVAHGLVVQDRTPNTVFVFSGMGPQWAGMGRGFWQSAPVFRDAVQEVEAAFRAHADVPIVQSIIDPNHEMGRCRIAQPTHFAMQVALVRMLAEHGLHPDMCLGHSAGEVAAAWAAGHFDLEQAVAVCWARSDLQERYAGQGGLIAVDMSQEEAVAFCSAWDGLEIAAVNGPNAMTLVGAEHTIGAALTALRAQGVAALHLPGDIPYHGAAMERILVPLQERLADLTPLPPNRALISSVTGTPINADGMNATYWAQNVRRPVQFRNAVQHALDNGATHFVEVGAKPVLQKAMHNTAKAAYQNATITNVSDAGADQMATFRAGIAAHHVSGGALDWDQLAGDGMLADLPPTGWQRQEFWHEAPSQAEDRLALAPARLMAEPGTAPRTWIADLNTRALAFLTEHRLDGLPVLPGAASLEAAVHVALASSDTEAIALQNIRFNAPFALDRTKGQILDTRRAGNSIETLAYDPAAPEGAQTILTADTASIGTAPEAVEISKRAAAAPYPLDIERLQDRLAALGLAHGDAFQRVTHVSMARSGKAALAQISVAPSLWQDGAFVLHPSLVDGVFQAGLALTVGTETLVPVRVDRCAVYGPLPARVWAWVALREEGATQGATFDAVIQADDGSVLAHLDGIRVMPLRPAPQPVPLPALCLETSWSVSPLSAATDAHVAVTVLGKSAHKLADAFAALDVQPGGKDATILVAFEETGDHSTRLAALLEHARNGDGGRLYVVTDRAQQVASETVDPDQAAYWGMGRTLYNEVIESGTTLIDVVRGEDWPSDVAQEVQAQSHSSEVAWRGGQRYLPRLTPIDLQNRAPRLKRDRTYLITGGLGGLGRSLALWCAENGAGHLVLSTRHMPERAEVLPLERSVVAAGATLEIVELDVTDADAVNALICRLDGRDHRLAGIFHWAGQTQDQLAQEMTLGDLNAVIQPKALGARHLHAASQNCRLDHFVMASSLSAVVGNQRQANYAAANAYLDGLAWKRHARELPALSVNFGAVSGTGMAADPRVAAHLRAAGLPAMTAATALAGLGAAMVGDTPQVSLAQGINVARWVRYDPRCAETDKMIGIVGDASAVAHVQTDITTRLRSTPAQGHAKAISAHLTTCVANMMNCPPERLVPDRALARQGMDSLTAVELQIAIEQDLGLRIPVVALIGGQSLSQIATHLAKEWTHAQT